MIHARVSHGQPSAKETEYLEGWRRERAELANVRKRMIEQTAQFKERSLREIIQPLLGVSDNFQAIIAHVPEALKDNAWAAGVLHVARQLEEVLRQYDVHPIDAVGKTFDPREHEAIEHVKDDKHPSGVVVAVVQPGYRLGDEVVKPTKVKISS